MRLSQQWRCFFFFPPAFCTARIPVPHARRAMPQCRGPTPDWRPHSHSRRHFRNRFAGHLVVGPIKLLALLAAVPSLLASRAVFSWMTPRPAVPAEEPTEVFALDTTHFVLGHVVEESIDDQVDGTVSPPVHQLVRDTSHTLLKCFCMTSQNAEKPWHSSS